MATSFTLIFSAIPVLFFASLLLVIRIVIGVLNQEKNSYKKFELEIVDKRISEMNITAGRGATLKDSYYKARYWDNEEKIIEFKICENVQPCRSYSVNEKFYGYVSPDNKKVVHEEDFNNRKPTVLTILIVILYSIAFFMIISGFIKPLRVFLEQNSVLVILSLFLVIGIVVIVLGIKQLIKYNTYIKKKEQHYFKEIVATIIDIYERYEKSNNSNTGHYFYYPIVNYDLNGELKTRRCVSGEKYPTFKKGDSYILYQDPVTGEIVEDVDNKNNKIKGIGFIVTGLLVTLNVIFLMVLQFI